METNASHSKVLEYPSTLTTFYTPIIYLRRPSVAVHLRELQLRGGSRSLGESGIPDDVAESLSARPKVTCLVSPSTYLKEMESKSSTESMRFVCALKDGDYLCVSYCSNTFLGIS